MASTRATKASANFVLTAETLNKALPKMHFTTQAVHADDFVSPHRAIAPAMHPAVNYRYARDPDELVEMENDDVWSLLLNSGPCLLLIYLTAQRSLRLARLLALHST